MGEDVATIKKELTIEQRIERIEAMVEIILAFVENVEAAMQEMQSNPMFAALGMPKLA